MLVGPARRDVGEDSDGDNLEQQHQGIGEAAHGSHQNLGGRLRSCAVCRGERGGGLCVPRLPSAAVHFSNKYYVVDLCQNFTPFAVSFGCNAANCCRKYRCSCI